MSRCEKRRGVLRKSAHFLALVIDAIFGCRHLNLSNPYTPRGPQRTEAAMTTGTYIVCLDCGKEFAYDLHNMSIVPHGTPRDNP